MNVNNPLFDWSPFFGVICGWFVWILCCVCWRIYNVSVLLFFRNTTPVGNFLEVWWELLLERRQRGRGGYEVCLFFFEKFRNHWKLNFYFFKSRTNEIQEQFPPKSTLPNFSNLVFESVLQLLITFCDFMLFCGIDCISSTVYYFGEVTTMLFHGSSHIILYFLKLPISNLFMIK